MIRTPILSHHNNTICVKIQEVLLSSSRRRRRGEEMGEGTERREKGSAIEVDIAVHGSQSEIKLDRRPQGVELARGWDGL